MNLDEYINDYTHNNINGAYCKENVVKKKYENIYKMINDFINENNIDVNIKFTEKLYLFINNVTEIPKCSNCNKKVKFHNRNDGYFKTCSNSCSTKLNRHKGVQTLIKTHGVNHPSKLPDVIEKTRLKKIHKVSKNIYPAELLSFDNNVLKIKCDKCNEIHETPYNIYGQRVQLDLDWRDCVTGKTYGKSNGEIELFEYIKTIYSGIILDGDRKALNGKELDIYLPELNLAFEFNGIYYHCELYKDKKYHYDKYKLCEDSGIQLIQIYEDEWMYKQDIVKSRINNLLDNSEKIYARKCVIKEVPFKIVKEFLINNHLQGSVNSSINLGLYYNDELVSLMTFGKPRKGMKYKTKIKKIYELYRFCNKLNTTVIGGASRLFKYFINNYTPKEVYSFSLLEWKGNVYEKIGFTLKNISQESYWFIDGKRRISRHTYNKQNLVKMGHDEKLSASQILKQLKIYKIYGAGNKCYVWYK
jgi:hypothetical protein